MKTQNKTLFQLVVTNDVLQTEKEDRYNEVYSVLGLYYDNEVVQSKFIYDVTRIRSQAENILDVLSKNPPLPSNLSDFVEQLL